MPAPAWPSPATVRCTLGPTAAIPPPPWTPASLTGVPSGSWPPATATTWPSPTWATSMPGARTTRASLAWATWTRATTPRWCAT